MLHNQDEHICARLLPVGRRICQALATHFLVVRFKHLRQQVDHLSDSLQRGKEKKAKTVFGKAIKGAAPCDDMQDAGGGDS